MIETRAPGKLFIVGEYAVVEPGEPAVLVAVDRYLHVRLAEREGAAAPASSEHVRAAIRAIDELREARGIPARGFEIEIESELDDEQGRKFGLGSSAAVTVALVDALDRFYALSLDAVERFKLALLATIEISPRASGGDIAASTFGGWIRYSSPDRAALAAHRAQHGIVATMGSPAWDGFSMRPLPAPTASRLLVGWTGSPASTKHLVDSVARANRSVARTEEQRAEFLAESRACVDALVAALEAGGADASAPDADPARTLRTARALLQRLAIGRGITIETDALRELCDIAERHGATAKPSGAGGGDCGIVLAGRDSDVGAILREWEEHGIRRLDLEVHPSIEAEEGEAHEH